MNSIKNQVKRAFGAKSQIRKGFLKDETGQVKHVHSRGTYMPKLTRGKVFIWKPVASQMERRRNVT